MTNDARPVQTSAQRKEVTPHFCGHSGNPAENRVKRAATNPRSPKEGAAIERTLRMRWSLLLLLASGLGLGADPVVKPDQFLPGQVAGTQILRPAMPMPMFVGPGPPYPNPEIPNLESRDSSPYYRREMVVQAGVKLLSQGCTVTSSDPAPLGDLSLITDGERFGDDGYFTELAPGKQWVHIDLRQSQRLHLIWIWHYHRMPVSYRDIVIQISDDPGFKTSTTVYNTDHDNSFGLGNGKDPAYYEGYTGRAFAFTPVSRRYVRLWSNGADVLETNCYIEGSVYGEPAAPGAK